MQLWDTAFDSTDLWDCHQSQQTDLIILDYSKAFEKVPHEHLLHNLNHCGVQGLMLSWIKVSSPNVPSQTRGGPCDSVVVYYMVQSLDPYSFSFSHGSAQPISQSKTHLFPEDCIVYIKITTESECQLLRDNLKTTANWKKKQHFLPHISSWSPIISSLTSSYKGHALQFSTTSKYLRM